MTAAFRARARLAAATGAGRLALAAAATGAERLALAVAATGAGRLALAVAVAALATAAGAAAARPPDSAADHCGFFYGTYSVGPKEGGEKVPVGERLQQIRTLGANMVVATGDKTKVLDHLPEGMLAVPGCGLMKKKDWQRDGRWDESAARTKLAELGERFANDPRVYGVCLTHEVTEYADHARRVWMYKLAKEFFPRKKVIQYYGTIYDRLGASGEKRYSYGENGEVETDVFFVSLPAVGKDGQFTPDKAKRLDVILESAARTPGIPVWGQTSINADHKYVHGAESMYAIWGRHGENMQPWVESLLRTERRDASGHPIRLSGFFWRSLGRFPYDLGYPPFVEHRERMRAIAANVCRMRGEPASAAASAAKEAR